MIGVRVDDELLDEIDRVRGSMSRSDFVRMAAYNALKEAGSALPESVIQAPDRAGKGGRPRKDNAVALVREPADEYNPKKEPKP